MKSVRLRSVVMLGLSLACLCSPAIAVDANEAGQNGADQLGPLAVELLGIYGTPKRMPEGQVPQAFRPPALLPQHLEPKYLQAWEELLNALIVGPTREINFMGDRIIEAFWRMGAPESVPALTRALENTIANMTQQQEVIHRQENILQALVVICDTNALEAILHSLDAMDNAYGDQERATTADGLTLREKTYRLMVQPENPCKSSAQMKEIEKAEKWKSLLSGYNKKTLSEKNRELVGKAKSFKRNE